ncbi:MAG TPA: ATP-binding cassette domain-containing protein [Microbacteriaceae bacterium]
MTPEPVLTPDPTSDHALQHSASALQADGLGLTFALRRSTDRQTIFADVSFTVADGTALCLAGRSGVGKTSVLRACAGFVPATEGTLAWRGTSMTAWAESDWEAWRAGHLGFLDQDSEMNGMKGCLASMLTVSCKERSKRSVERSLAVPIVGVGQAPSARRASRSRCPRFVMVIP